MIDSALATLLFVTGLMHIVPASGALSARRLHALYGVELGDPALVLLLRHRALLFGILGALFIAAAFMPSWRIAASVVALSSMLSFVALARANRWSPAIQRVVRIDGVVSALLSQVLAARVV